MAISSMGYSFPNFRKNSNSDYQKSSLTFISEYQKLTVTRYRLVVPGAPMERLMMESSNWASAHSEMLREGVARGMSYSEIAEAINAKFGTCYSRNATIGRGKRMGLGTPARSDHRSAPPPRRQLPKPSKKRAAKMRERRAAELQEPAPVRERSEPVRLRCVGLSPRLMPLTDLEAGDCRYPYGGDKEGEAITFCGHPRLAGSSYCSSHFHLTREGGCASDRAAGPVALRLVEAA
jgi:GcrA cell cycle regulator